MGVYSNNRTQLGTYSAEEVTANESYSHQSGLLEMVIDNAKNDQAIFEAVITNDFKEAIPGAVAESAEIVQESISGFIDKVKEFVKKCWEKVKGIFKSFITKINNVIMRDNKEFVNKYKKEVLAKDLSKMKYKWAEPTAKTEKGDNAITLISQSVNEKYKSTTSLAKSEISSIEDELSSGEYLDDLLSKSLSSSAKTTSAEFTKDYHSACFGESDDVENLDKSRLVKIMNTLINSADSLKAISDYEKDTNTLYSTLLKTIDSAIDKSAKAINGESGDKELNVFAQKNIAYKIIQVMQTSTQKIIGAQMEACKFTIAQSRRVFAQAASFNPKSVKENAIFVEAVGDAAEYEVLSSFNDYSL